MSETRERILKSFYDAMLDDALWPAASALIDEACGLTGNGLLVVEGTKQDARLCPLGLYYRGEPLQRGVRVLGLPGQFSRRPSMMIANPSSLHILCPRFKRVERRCSAPGGLHVPESGAGVDS